MARAFWDAIPDNLALDVALFPESQHQRAPYPARHRYVPVDWHGNENASVAGIPGLLIGDTPVTDAEGLHWPMRFLTPRLQHFHDQGQSVDALGVGVDQELTPAARQIFEAHFLPIRSWTVRSENCRQSLIALGVDETKIRVGADWAWIYRPRDPLQEWARNYWRGLGVEPDNGLLIVNVVNMHRAERPESNRMLVQALDWVSRHFELQIAFFCNESRSGTLFDFEAASAISSLMRRPFVLVPNEYYSPDETIALLSFAAVTLGERYHFLIETVLAGSVPVALLRGEKMKILAEELSIPVAGDAATASQYTISDAIGEVLNNRAAMSYQLTQRKQQLAERALVNLSYLRTLTPFSQLAAPVMTGVQSA